MPEEEKKKILSLVDFKDKVILDVGCGDGRYSEILKEKCQKYIGIDVDEELIFQNNLKNQDEKVTFLCTNIKSYHEAEKFDVIILSLSFHEIDIKEQGIALLNMLGLLKEDGKIIILDPRLDSNSFQGLWNVAYENLILFHHDYIVKHSKEVIQKAVENKLCKVVKEDILDIKFEFENFEEIWDMLKNSDDFKEVEWDRKTKQRLDDALRNFLKSDNPIILYDKLDITIIEK